MQGYISSIQRFSIHDGPGIRTTIFLKGCVLRCKWCCNPESIDTNANLLYNSALCIECGKCVEVCPTGAKTITGLNRSLCNNCGICAEVCHAEALTINGRLLSSEELLQEIIKDMSFYIRSGGGATFSGGEPLLQIDFLEELLMACYKNNISTVIDTCGHVPWEYFERILSYSDIFLYDIKSTDSNKHFAFTGVRCEHILQNCERLVSIGKNVIIRVPVIPIFNFDLDTLTNIVRFAERIGVKEVNFLPYHRLATSKYSFLGWDYWNPGISRLENATIAKCINQIETKIKLQIGG